MHGFQELKNINPTILPFQIRFDGYLKSAPTNSLIRNYFAGTIIKCGLGEFMSFEALYRIRADLIHSEAL